MPENYNIIDILNQQTARDAREYSQGYEGTSGLPSIVRQVDSVERERNVSPFSSYSPREQAYNRGIYDSMSADYEEAIRPEGYRPSRKDEVWTSGVDVAHTEDRKAMQQSGAEQLINGISKGVVIAGTTFVDGIVGTAAGIANLAWQAANGNIERPADALYAFIDNPVSKNLQKINEWAEKVMPNYYSDEQRNAKWYEPVNLFSANFIGDKFLKNTGFMIGAAYSGRVNAGTMSKIVGKKQLRDAFKGVVVNLNGEELNTAAKIYKAYKTGDALMDGVKLTEDLAKQAKQIRNQEWGLKLLGSMTAAAGEARIEAITNTEDYVKRMQQKLDVDREDAISRVHDAIIARSTVDNPTYKLVLDPETGQAMPVLTQLGQNLANEMLGDIEQRYQDANIKLQKDRAVIANQIFGLNLFILTGTDLFTFGRFIAGGYNTKRGSKELSKKISQTEYKASMKERNKAIARAVSVPFVEGPYEEMMQQSVATGAGYNASAKMNRFYGYKIDQEAEDDAVNSVNAILEGIRDTYTNVDQWEQGAIGALSSMLGIPGFVESRDEKGNTIYDEKKDKNGKTYYEPKRKFRWQGEFWESIRDAGERAEDAKNITANLNEIVQKSGFADKWKSYIRHKSLDKIKEDAVLSGSPFNYQNADSDQIISDIMAFDKAGRIQDLYELIDENSNITINDVDAIRAATKDPQTNVSPYDNMLDEDVIEKVKKHAENFKNTLKSYESVRDNIRQVYGPNMNEEHEEALTWAYLSIENAENRMKEMASELIPKLNDIFHIYSVITGEEIGFNVNNLSDFYHFAFNGKARDKFIKAISSKSARNLSEEKILKFIQETIRQRDSILDMMQDTSKLSEEERKLLEKGRENAYNSYWEAWHLLDKIQKDPSLHPIADSEMNEVRSKMADLANITAYKTEFLNMLAKLTNNPGAFNKDIIQLQKKRQEDLDKTEAQKLYDSFNDDMDQRAFNQILATGIHNESQREKVFNLLKNSSNPKLKAMYQEFDKLNAAITSLVSASTLNDNDPNVNIKGAVNSILDNLLEKELPANVSELIDYIDNAANQVDNPIAIDYAKQLKNSISTTSDRRKVAENMVKPEEKKEKPEPAPATEPTEEDDDEDPIEKAFGPQEKKNDSASAQPDPSEVNRIVEETISKLSENELDDIIERNQIPASINGKIDIDSIKRLAQFYKDKKDGSLGGNPVVDKRTRTVSKLNSMEDEQASPQVKQEKQNGPKVYENTEGVVLNGLGVTGVNTIVLKNGLVEKYRDPNPSITKISETLDQEFNTYNFLDSGALASIEKMYLSKGQTTPIKFVFANKNEGRKFTHLHSIGKRNNDLYNILLAIEITDDIRNALNSQQKDQLRETAINDKTYQIVGYLKKINDTPFDSQAYQQIYDINIESVDEQREANPEQDLFVGNYRGLETSTSINKIYTGRRPVMAGTSIKSIIDTTFGGDIYFGCAVKSKRDGMIKIYSNKPDYISLRTPNDIGIDIPSGMVFAFVPTPDGTYSYVPVVMSTSQDVDFTANNEFVNNLRSAVATLLDANKSQKDKMSAKIEIMRSFLLGNTPFYFRKDELSVFRFDGNMITSWDDFVNAMQAKQFRVQFDRRAIESASADTYVNMMVDADLMKVNYKSLRSYGSSFTVNALGKTGRPIEQKRKTVQQVRSKYKVPSNFDVVMDGNNYYAFTEDGIIDMSNGSRVTNAMVIARARLLYMITRGTNDIGMPMKTTVGKAMTLYEIEPSLDGARPRMFMMRNNNSTILQAITEFEANQLRAQLEKESHIKEAQEAADSRYSLQVFDGDDAAVPVKAEELTLEQLKPKPISDSPLVVEEAPAEPLKPTKRSIVPQEATRTDADVSVANAEITDRDRQLAKQIRENKWNPKVIEDFFANHGVRMSLSGLNKTAMAQVINKAFDDNPELTIDKMLTEINCGKHGN